MEGQRDKSQKAKKGLNVTLGEQPNGLRPPCSIHGQEPPTYALRWSRLLCVDGNASYLRPLSQSIDLSTDQLRGSCIADVAALTTPTAELV